MKKEILINTTINEVRVAILEDKKLVEYFIESPDNEKIVGNIYFGKVTNVIQGINAAFVNIGFKTDAFLHFSDVDESLENNFFLEDDDDDEELVLEETQAINNKSLLKKGKNFKKSSPTFQTKKSGEVKINLEQGQEVIVQVTREAYMNKGVKVTSRISIAGKYLVLMPFDRIVGVSKKIQSYQERKRLRRIAKSLLPDNFGCIIRTASLGKNDEDFAKDLDYLLKKWYSIEAKLKSSKPPTILHQDLDLVQSIIRDLFTSDVNMVSIDNRKLFNEIKEYLDWFSPQLSNKIQLYTEKAPIFEYHDVEKHIQNIYKSKVNLVSGASIVIEQTEAMTVVDVNSGRAVEKDQEQTALIINLEAAKEVARQLRLRDAAGMIVIDFIDMTYEQNRIKLFNDLRRELSKDRAKTAIYPLTQLGLMQITRQRIHQNITEKISDVCSNCSGTGRIFNKAIILQSIERWLRNFRTSSFESKVMLTVSPDLAEFLTEGSFNKLSRLMLKYFVRIRLQQSEKLNDNTFKFYSIKYQKDITQDYN